MLITEPVKKLTQPKPIGGKGNMRIYACGGCGTNIVAKMNLSTDVIEGYAGIEVAYIDASNSNQFQGIMNDSNTLFISEKGSGSHRRTNYEQISEMRQTIIKQFPPHDINIVVHSASGGSGSVIGPVLVSELLDRDQNVVVIMIGSIQNVTYINNTINTIASMEQIADKRNRPVPVFYIENPVQGSRREVDQQAQGILGILSVIYSGQNREVDQEDLTNHLNYNRITKHRPGIIYMDITGDDEINLDKGERVITAITLEDSDTISSLGSDVELQIHGIAHEKVIYKNESNSGDQSVTGLRLPLHYITIAGRFQNIMRRLDELRQTYYESSQAFVQPKTIPPQGVVSDDGLVL